MIWNLKPNLGIAWFFLSCAFVLHVVDEAVNDFLQVYNPTVINIKENFTLLPLPTFTFGTWIAGLIMAILILFALSPLAFKNINWVKKFSYFYGIVMLLNGIGHILGSFALGDFMPGVYSAPLLIITSLYLLWSVIRLNTKQ
jgi:hypothetical protein